MWGNIDYAKMSKNSIYTKKKERSKAIKICVWGGGGVV